VRERLLPGAGAAEPRQRLLARTDILEQLLGTSEGFVAQRIQRS
jgi:hypothetical protein